MNNLKSAINRVPNNRISLISSNESLSYGDLKNFIKNNKATVKKLQGANIAIKVRDRIDFAKIIILLDGEVNNMLFLPKDIDKKSYKKYYKKTNICYEVFLKNNTLNYKVLNQITKHNSTTKTNWIIPTSGTTNTPKLVAHTFASLTRTTKKNMNIGKEYRWGLVFDIYRFSGIQVILQALLSGAALIITEAKNSLSEVLEALVKHQCNALSGTSSFWRKTLMFTDAEKLKLKTITLGGEIADRNILRALRLKFNDAKITHIYASTEAGVGFTVSDGLPGFPSNYLENGFKGVELKISKNNTLMLKQKKQNQRYIDSKELYEEDGYIDSGDIIEIKNNRAYFLGRSSGSINVGGNKVHPEEVEQVLIETGLVESAYVYPRKSEMMGNIVCADVALKDTLAEPSKIKTELLNHCKEKLNRFKIPAILKFVTKIEINQNGKLKRN